MDLQAPNPATTPDALELRTLLDQHRPATVLRSLGEDLSPQLAIYKAEALMELDRYQEAQQLLDPVIGRLEGDEFAEAERLWALILTRSGYYDGAILSASHAAREARNEETRAAALAWGAVGYAYKRCWGLAETGLREAIELSPNNPRVLVAQARVRLQSDQRIEARRVYERMTSLGSIWAKAYGQWGCSYIAYLLGEFDQARYLAETALAYSEEMVTPLFVLSQVALAREDFPGLQAVIAQLEQRSPRAEGLKWLNEELVNLQSRQGEGNALGRKRLRAFPTMVQRRDYCGPSTIELVLRYWKGGLDFDNDQIAGLVKMPQAGTPIYRMREFFHLLGFDTVRPVARLDKLKKLIDAGYPVILQEEFSNSSHVVVMIGYDEAAGVVELQDPMTHTITRTPVDVLDRLRKIYNHSAVIAFPRGLGHEKVLGRMGLFDSTPVVWADQSVLELDEGRPQACIALTEKATRRMPALGLAWIMELYGLMETWRSEMRMYQESKGVSSYPPEEHSGADPAGARERFYAVLENARLAFPEAEFIYQFAGNGALMDHDVPRALAAFQRASEADPDDSRNFASAAECYYAQREYEKAFEAAWKSLQRDPTLPAGNAWMARAQAALNEGDAGHYARVAVELAPDWWLSHVALAEAMYRREEYLPAQREAELAVSLSPDQVEPWLVRGLAASALGDDKAAASHFHRVLDLPQLTLSASYRARQGLCRIAFSAHKFEKALKQAHLLQALAPDDPWTLQFLAAARCELLLQQETGLDEAEIDQALSFYEQSIQVNKGASWVIKDYLNYRVALAGRDSGLEAIERLRQAYPDKGNLIFFQAQQLGHAGQAEAAARMMLDALKYPDGVENRDELYQAIDAILDGLGVEAGEQEILALPPTEGGAPIRERVRALGLSFARSPLEHGERARGLLRESVADNPEDALATLRLGDVAQSELDRELCYRRALILSPRWALARSNLAEFLIEQGREEEALEFTSGHESESQELGVAHAKALIGVGHYEEAVVDLDRILASSEGLDSTLHAYRWIALLQSGQRKSALKAARHGVKLFPQDLTWYIRLATSFRELERLAEARQVLEKGRQMGLSEMDVLKAEYEMAWLEKDYENALAVTEALLALSDEKTGDGRLGWVESRRLRLFVQLGRIDEARSFLENENLEAAGWGEAAWTVMQTDAHLFTLELAQRTLALSSQEYHGLYARAQALNDLGREEEAVAAFQELREAFPEEHNSYEKLALRLALDGSLDEALEYAEHAVEFGLFCPYAWAVRGLVLYIRGQVKEAMSDLQTGWNRADVQRRRKSLVFWWLLAHLEGDEHLAENRKRQALEEARTDFDWRLIYKMEAIYAGR